MDLPEEESDQVTVYPRYHTRFNPKRAQATPIGTGNHF